MPEYGSKEYWDKRYSRVTTPFDWMTSYENLAPTLEPLLPDKDKRILIVGCGDAPFSADLFHAGGYCNQVNADYSEIVIDKQMQLWPEIDWRVMDCLNMNQIEDSSFDVVIDKSLIDTTMCYQNGFDTTMRLYSELHRVLKPGGRLITISLHTEEEVLTFGCSNPKCSFVFSSCSVSSERQPGVYHAVCVFDKIAELDPTAKSELIAAHPLVFINSVYRKKSPQSENLSAGCDTDDESVDYYFGFGSEEDLILAFGKALEDTCDVA
eukprot:CCRYP_008690-RE/>CCRYP_008690-RE protein AED:0.42 eAED:0.42 QI:381/1/1/1/1/1/2/219/265